jgi:hypothetical protein
LSLGYTRIGDAGLAHLKSLKSLTFLHLGDTRVTPAALEELRTTLPGLKVVP